MKSWIGVEFEDLVGRQRFDVVNLAVNVCDRSTVHHVLDFHELSEKFEVIELCPAHCFIQTVFVCLDLPFVHTANPAGIHWNGAVFDVLLDEVFLKFIRGEDVVENLLTSHELLYVVRVQEIWNTASATETSEGLQEWLKAQIRDQVQMNAANSEACV